MGILQSCQNDDTRISLPLDNSFIRNSLSYRYSPTDFSFQASKLKLFGDIFYKKLPNKTQFVLQTHLVNRNPDVISHAIKIYENSASFMLQRGNKIKIVNCINDPNQPSQGPGSQIYIMKLANKPYQYFLKIIPFNRYQQEIFKRGLYQVFMLQKSLKDESNKYAFHYNDAFVIQSGIDKDKNDKCLVIIGDCASATLHEMIEFRKLQQSGWGQKQYQTLCYQLIKGLATLHKSNIYHRDIRPHNIIYSPQKKGYILSGLGNSIAIKNINQSVGINLAGVPYLMPKHLIEVGIKEDFSEYYNYNLNQYDSYQLGITLLNTLFLDEFMPVDAMIRSVDKYSQKYKFLGIIKAMLSPNPPLISQLLKTIPSPSISEILQNSQIQSLRFRLKPQDQQFVSRKRNVAQAYYHMFMYDQWVQQINEVVNYYELNRDFLQLGDIYKQIADIYSQHHQQQMMQDYYGKACKIYLQISEDCMQQKKLQQTIKYLEKGISCNRLGYKGGPNLDLASLLNKLAMVHHSKAEYQVARAFQQQSLQIIHKVLGDNSSQYAQMLIDAAKIQSEFQQFKIAENMLKAGLKIIDRKQLTNENQKIKAKLLESLGSNFRMKAIERRDKCDVYRKKAEECLLDALQITQRIEGSIHPQVGSILLNLGNVYFDRKQFQKAKKSYERSLMVKQHSMKGRNNLQVGQCLTYLANSQKSLKQYQQAIRHYDQAIEVFRKVYGNDHNQHTAVAIGNLGLVYKEIGKKQQQKQYLSLAKTILKDLYGQQCPDYLFFDRQMSK